MIAAAVGARHRDGHRPNAGAAVVRPHRVAEVSATVPSSPGGGSARGRGLSRGRIDSFGRKLKHRPSLSERASRSSGGPGRANRSASGQALPGPGAADHPVPEQAPPILVGALADAAIDRAAEIGDGFLDTLNAGAVKYTEALGRAGKDPAEGRVYALQWPVIDEDPERAWAEIGKHSVYQWNEYVSWGVFGPPDEVPRYEDPAQLVEAGFVQLWDASTAIDQLTSLLQERPQIRDLHFWGHLPGESVESGSRRVEYLATKVMPEVMARTGRAHPQ